MKIETKRSIIREFRNEDIDGFIVYRNDMEWMKYQGFKGLSKEEYIQALLINRCTVDTGIQLAIIDKSTDDIIGDIYLKKENNDYWIGYTVCKSKAKQGYAYECVQAVMWWLEQQGAQRIMAAVLKGNLASIELLKKLQFSYIGEEDGENIFEYKINCQI